MRILHVISGVPPRAGGPSTVLRSLAATQVRRGHEVTVCTTNVDFPEGVLDVPTDRAVDEGGVTYLYHALDLRVMYFSRSLGEWLRRHVSDFDIVHIHGVYRFPPTWAAAQARRKEVPYLIRPHGSLDPFMYRQSRHSILLKRVYERLFDLPNLNSAAAVQFTSVEEAERAAFLRLRAPAVVISNGLDWADFETVPDQGLFRERVGLPRDAPLILFLGRLNFKKGLDLLVPAFAKVLKQIPNAWLAVVGPDNDGLGGSVRTWCAEQGVTDRVRFFDHVSALEAREAYVDADVFALTSYTENTGMTVVEAMACRCPVVISDQVNICSVVQRAEAGLVVPLQVDAIARALLSVLRDESQAARMGRAGRVLAEKKFSWHRIVDELDDLYRSVVKGEDPLSAVGGAKSRATSG